MSKDVQGRMPSKRKQAGEERIRAILEKAVSTAAVRLSALSLLYKGAQRVATFGSVCLANLKKRIARLLTTSFLKKTIVFAVVL